MIGIYEDKFEQYLEERLGYVKVKSKNIITRCPWCELDERKKHYHLYISTEAPIFHCFFNDCGKSGTISKLIRKIEGKDLSDSFIDKTKIKEAPKERMVISTQTDKQKKISVPPLNEDHFKMKSLYMKKRLKFANVDLSNIKGLIFDVNKFLELNVVPKDETLIRMQDYIHSNFVGFLTENESKVVFRNIDDTQNISYYKLQIKNTVFLDYFKIEGVGFNSKDVVLAEGTFDILAEHTFDSTGLKNKAKLYACGLSVSYDALLNSIAFNEQIFRMNVHILSDRGVSLDYYKKVKKYSSVVNSMTVYYNKSGKDFADTPVILEKFIL